MSHEVNQAWHGLSFSPCQVPGYSTFWVAGPEQSEHRKAGPRQASWYPAGGLRGGADGLWALAWGRLALPHVGGGQPSSWGRNPLLSCASSGRLGLLTFGQLLKPGADYGLNPGSATVLLGDLGQVTLLPPPLRSLRVLISKMVSHRDSGSALVLGCGGTW